MRKLSFVCLLGLIALALGAAAAEEDLGGLYLNSRLGTADIGYASARDLGLPDGTVYTVYAAPFADAYTGAGWQLEMSGDTPVSILAEDESGEWYLVRFRRPNVAGGLSLGWVHAPEWQFEGWSWETLWPDWIPLTVTAETYLADGPDLHAYPLSWVKAGERVIGLEGGVDAYGRQWVLAETQKQGRRCWGFMPADCLRGEALWHVDGDTLVVHEGVVFIGSPTRDIYDEDGVWIGYRQEALPAGTVRLQASWALSEALGQVRRISLPESLRGLGRGAFYDYRLNSLTLPAGVEVYSGALMGGVIGTLTVCTDSPGLPDCLEETAVGAFETGPSVTAYSARDGVLFSGDGSVLLLYPGAREALHYDVPAGTRELADWAFGMEGIPLRTISLPLGLRRIGAHAFNGCERLTALTVPPTVTDLDPSALAGCVSLERVSLPAGVTAPISRNNGRRYTDPNRFSGDQGETLTTASGQLASVYSANRLAVLAGEADILLRSQTVPDLTCTAAPGTCLPLERVEVDTCLVGLWDDLWRVDRAHIRPLYAESLFEYGVCAPASGTVTGLPELPLPWAPRQEGVCLSTALLEPRRAGGTDCLAYMEFTLTQPQMVDGREVGRLYVPITQLRLTRKAVGDGRVCCVFAGEGGMAVYDRPEGSPLGLRYTGEQAVLLAEDGDWARITDGLDEYWTRRENLTVVPEEA